MPNRYKIRQNLISIGDDFWIENAAGQKVFKVDGKVLRIRKTLVFEDVKGRKLAQIKERLISIKDTMVIEDADGRDVAVVKKALIAPLRDKWNVNVKGGDDLVVQGNILDLEYDIRQGRTKVAEISKKWFTLTDTYGVEIADAERAAVVARPVRIEAFAVDPQRSTHAGAVIIALSLLLRNGGAVRLIRNEVAPIRIHGRALIHVNRPAMPERRKVAHELAIQK